MAFRNKVQVKMLTFKYFLNTKFTTFDVSIKLLLVFLRAWIYVSTGEILWRSRCRKISQDSDVGVIILNGSIQVASIRSAYRCDSI